MVFSSIGLVWCLWVWRGSANELIVKQRGALPTTQTDPLDHIIKMRMKMIEKTKDKNDKKTKRHTHHIDQPIWQQNQVDSEDNGKMLEKTKRQKTDKHWVNIKAKQSDGKRRQGIFPLNCSSYVSDIRFWLWQCDIDHGFYTLAQPVETSDFGVLIFMPDN